MIPSNIISLCLYYLNSYFKCFMARRSHSTSFVCRSLFFFSLLRYPPPYSRFKIPVPPAPWQCLMWPFTYMVDLFTYITYIFISLPLFLLPCNRGIVISYSLIFVIAYGSYFHAMKINWSCPSNQPKSSVGCQTWHPSICSLLRRWGCHPYSSLIQHILEDLIHHGLKCAWQVA